LYASFLKNMAVFSKDMVNLGKVKDLEFDPAEMKVTNVIVEFPADEAKYLLGKKLVLRHATGRVPGSSVESIKDALNLKLPRKDLEKAFKGVD